MCIRDSSWRSLRVRRKRSLRTVTFGLQTATNSLPFYIAKEEGFFEEEGINAEFLVYTSGGAQIEAAASNAWMFGTGGVFPAITGMLNIDTVSYTHLSWL